MSYETLKPCPFCGGPANTYTDDDGATIGCDTNGCGSAIVSGVDLAAASLRWNTRSDESRIRAEAAAERTAAILEILRRHDLRDCSPGYLAGTIEMAFPKPGGAP